MKKAELVKIAKQNGVEADRISNLENTDNWMITHAPTQCSGQRCVIHNRSDHSMRTFPQHFRYDRGIMERICRHGIGHPDPDQDDFFNDVYGAEAWAQWVHGCDGCCV